MVSSCWAVVYSRKDGGSASSVSGWMANSNKILTGSRSESVSARGAVWRWERIKTKYKNQNKAFHEGWVDCAFPIKILLRVKVLVTTNFAICGGSVAEWLPPTSWDS